MRSGTGVGHARRPFGEWSHYPSVDPRFPASPGRDSSIVRPLAICSCRIWPVDKIPPADREVQRAEEVAERQRRPSCSRCRSIDTVPITSAGSHRYRIESRGGARLERHVLEFSLGLPGERGRNAQRRTVTAHLLHGGQVGPSTANESRCTSRVKFSIRGAALGCRRAALVHGSSSSLAVTRKPLSRSHHR
jgi:hypothetical protein